MLTLLARSLGFCWGALHSLASTHVCLCWLCVRFRTARVTSCHGRDIQQTSRWLRSHVWDSPSTPQSKSHTFHTSQCFPDFCDLSYCALPHSKQLSVFCSHGIDSQALHKQVSDLVEYITVIYVNIPVQNSIQECPEGGVSYLRGNLVHGKACESRLKIMSACCWSHACTLQDLSLECTQVAGTSTHI